MKTEGGLRLVGELENNGDFYGFGGTHKKPGHREAGAEAGAGAWSWTNARAAERQLKLKTESATATARHLQHLIYYSNVNKWRRRPKMTAFPVSNGCEGQLPRPQDFTPIPPFSFQFLSQLVALAVR